MNYRPPKVNQLQRGQQVLPDQQQPEENSFFNDLDYQQDQRLFGSGYPSMITALKCPQLQENKGPTKYQQPEPEENSFFNDLDYYSQRVLESDDTHFDIMYTLSN
ncbi:unnamed protein product (macronuclear) [Paramecium tetraurelia]|uniref:Uncharacterized protein n=1 Tax=Paramecium tetraurelia TaxID=5888 RepID=A0EBM7_PARTE|nr:uncharacterized protein GSPATT00025428001 [Paramecium tetraurelia]CAK92694.1 unnamed protein product [Paramecium tetraurelia]|eukprot:XP_001460091.1 hypothetical protein (macronuclear) [Paramecium tetraurelia strain d4-2]